MFPLIPEVTCFGSSHVSSGKKSHDPRSVSSEQRCEMCLRAREVVRGFCFKASLPSPEELTVV